MFAQRLPTSALAFILAGILFASSALAQSEPEAANQAAYQTFLSGDYEKAATEYEAVIKNYPTASIIASAQLQLAYTYFFLSRYEEAEEILNKLFAGPPPPPAINEAGRSILPQVLSAQASAMEPDDPKRKPAYEAAIKGFSEFIKTFQQSPEVEQAIYGRALANFQLGNYADAISDLEGNVSKFPNSSTISASRNLLALAYATKGSVELNKGDAAQRDAAFADYQKAIEILRGIIANRTDLTLVNDAQFQLGEILFNLAAFSDEDKRPPLYDEALDAYRSVLPKEEIVELQQKRVDSFPDLRAAAIRSGDEQARDRLNKDNERELKRLAALQSKPGQTTPAMLKMAEIFFNRGQLNASRVLLQHLSPYLTTDDEKKRALYFKAMTYAMQNVAEQTVDAYEEFQSQYKGDPIAANLPLAVGNIYLSSSDPNVNSPETAAKYFEESLELYPDGTFAGLSTVNRASALSRLGKADEALKTFQDFLKNDPKPQEAVVARMGLANILKDTGKLDEAVTEYQTVLEKYPDQPQAAEAQFWIAFATQQKGDPTSAIPLYQDFVAKNGDSQLVPTALYQLASAQLATKDNDAGIETLAEIAEKYPDSAPAPFTYFQRAQLFAAEGRQEEMLGLMRDFIETYPDDDKVFFAYDSIAQSALTSGDPDKALESYREFAEKKAGTPRAAEALLKISDLTRSQADRLGRYAAMPPEDQEMWQSQIDESVSAAETITADYADTPQVANALRGLLGAQRMLVSAGIKEPDDIESYFRSLAEDSSPAVASKAMFTLAGYLAEKDPALALQTMNDAYDSSLVYAPADLDNYGLALLENEKLDEALAAYEKLEADFPIPPGTEPTQATPEIQTAQATVLFGKGSVAQAKNETAEAGKLFGQLKSLYPWSPKVLEANYGIAQSLFDEEKYDEALGLLTQIIRTQTATAELRANSMLLGGDVMAAKGERDSAIDYYIKIADFYSGVPKPAAAGLWKGAQLLEEQVSTLTDPAAKTKQTNQYVRAYRELVENFPNSEFTPKAKERLTAIGK